MQAAFPSLRPGLQKLRRVFSGNGLKIVMGEVAMPTQEIFFAEKAGGREIVVMKTYDSHFAREAFDQMGEDAKAALAQTLLDEGANLEADSGDEDLWQAIEEGAREDWNSFSYFVVQEKGNDSPHYVFVSSDWPTAERFAKRQLAAAS
jgi:hypothetical protein